jgi:hemolysin activation/secretion protein
MQAGVRYVIPLPSIGKLMHQVTFGFDFKQSDSDLFFGGDQVFGSPTDIFQGVLAYHASLKDRLGSTSFRASVFASPGGWNSRNSDEAFESQRSGASSEYLHGQLGLDRVTRLPGNFSLVTRALWQWSDGNLLASEQLGLGGFNTVRGYEESEARGDGGFLLSAELRTLPLHPARGFGLPVNDELQFLGFVDWGSATLHDPLSSENDRIALAGVGIGLRYAFNPWLSVRFDWGWQLKDTGFNDRFDNRGHLAVVLSY